MVYFGEPEQRQNVRPEHQPFNMIYVVPQQWKKSML
jgi:hypothetical protein